MKNISLLAISFLTLGLTAFGEEYHELDKVQTLKCVSESGRTAVTVDRVGAYFEVTTIQDGRTVLNDRVRTTMSIQESFPASYIYKGRTTQKTYFSAGQAMFNFDENHPRFTKVSGTVHYNKAGVEFNTRVNCEVIE